MNLDPSAPGQVRTSYTESSAPVIAKPFAASKVQLNFESQDTFNHIKSEHNIYEDYVYKGKA